MARRRKLNEDQSEALLDILGRIENELPGKFVTASEDGEEEYEIEEFEGLEVSVVEVTIDEAISEYQKSKVFPKKKKGEFSLSELFEIFFGADHEIVDLVVELEAALSGYQDMIREDDVEAATELINEISRGVRHEAENSALHS